MYKTKKLKANITATIVILFISLLAFCACGIDASYVAVSRYKLQKITETMALVMASKLKAQEPGHRSKEELDLTGYNFEKLYSKPSSGFWNFEVKEIAFKEESNGDVKVKVFINADIPAYYLRFIGIRKITLSAVSYAKGESKTYETEPFDINYETNLTFDEIVTDKSGDDIEIEYEGDYFAYIGLKDSDGNIVWSDLGKKAQTEAVEIEISYGNRAMCLKGNNVFDLSKGANTEGSDIIGFTKYLRIYKADCTDGNPLKEDTFSLPLVKTLNNVKLIGRSLY